MKRVARLDLANGVWARKPKGSATGPFQPVLFNLAQCLRGGYSLRTDLYVKRRAPTWLSSVHALAARGAPR